MNKKSPLFVVVLTIYKFFRIELVHKLGYYFNLAANIRNISQDGKY